MMVKPMFAAVLLFLASALFGFALGSSPLHGDKDASEFDLKVFRGYVEKTRAQTLKHKDHSSHLAGLTAFAKLPDGDVAYPDASRDKFQLSAGLIVPSAISGRNLQGLDCSDGTTSIFVTSTVFALMEGCLSVVEGDGTTVYASDTAFIFPLEPTTTTDPPVWVAVYQVSTDDVKQACFSEESSDEVDPSKATWYCDSEGDGSFAQAGEELSVSCGCSAESPSPTTTAAPVPTTTTSTCIEGDSFSIASASLSDAEGCYIDTAVLFNEKPIYSISGTSDGGQILMVAFEAPGDDSSAPAILLWGLAYVAPDDGTDETETFCVSSVDAASYHPSEVPEWQCVEGISIGVECGCAVSSSSREFSPGPAPTPQPVESPPTSTPVLSPTLSPVVIDGPVPSSDTCSGDGSFTITANAAPNLEGCFKDTGSITSDGSVVYTVSGTTTMAEIVVASGESDDGDFIWSIADRRTSESLLYCVSVELASDVNPGNASWNCDFINGGDSLQAATEEDISVVCGSCTTAGGADASPACTLGVGPVVRGAAGVVTVAFSFSAWY